MPAVALRGAACGVVLALLVPLASASADEGDACITSYEHTQQLRRQGKPVRARAELRLCLGACPTLLARDCKRWLREVEPEIARVAITVRDEGGRPLAGARVLVDGAAVPDGDAAVELDPGPHVVHAEAPGRLAGEREIDARPGAPLSLELRLASLPPPPPPPPPAPARSAPRASSGAGDNTAARVGYVVSGVGVLSLAAAAGLSIAGHVKKAQLLDAGCKPYCSKQDVETIQTMWVTGGVLAGVGAVALGVSAGILWLLPETTDRLSIRPAAALAPTAGAAWLGVTGRF